MSIIVTGTLLVYLVSTTPVAHVRIVDKFESSEVCMAVIESVERAEASTPIAEQIHPMLRCLQVSYRYDPDGDGPSKPVSPKDESSGNSTPKKVAPKPVAPPQSMLNSKKNETFGCYNMLKTPVVCRNTTSKTSY